MDGYIVHSEKNESTSSCLPGTYLFPPVEVIATTSSLDAVLDTMRVTFLWLDRGPEEVHLGWGPENTLITATGLDKTGTTRHNKKRCYGFKVFKDGCT